MVQKRGSEPYHSFTKTKENQTKMPTTLKVSLSENNLARLGAKTWADMYTQVPNTKLPEVLKQQLGVIYNTLTGENFPQVGFTYLVRADNGVFKKVYSPSVYKTEEGNVIVRWGLADIPLVVETGKISAPKGNKKAKFSVREDSSGKFPETVLSVSVNEDGTLYTMSFPIRFADWENPLSADALGMLLDEAPDSIVESLAVAPDPNKKPTSSTRLVGPLVKIAYLPVGSYSVIGYTTREGNFGIDYEMQVVVGDPFVAPTKQKNEAGVWEDVEVQVENLVRVKPNTAIKKILAASPVITPANPETLEILEHGEYNGYPTAKAKLSTTNFAVDESSVDLNF